MYDGTGLNSTPLFFSLHRTRHQHTRRILLANIHAASILIDSILVGSYVQLPALCPSESCANHVTKLVDLRAAGILIDITLIASYLIPSMPLVSSSTSYSSRCIVHHPTLSVCLRAVLTMSRNSWAYVLFAILVAAGILIDIVLIASCHPPICLCF